MPTEILISSDPWENRVAILENGSLAEIYIEREEKVIGSIYKGKVQNVLPGMGASFIDIGIGRNAFLYVDDINKAPMNIGDVEITQGRPGWTINDKVNRGDEVLVQIIKEARGLKGARVSTNISLPGRYLILMPTGKFSGVSRKIESAEERTRLKNVMKRIRPDEMATIVRTAAAGVSDAELIADLGVLIRMWHGILENYKSSACPSLIHKDMNLVFKAARDFITPEINRVLVDNPEECEKLRDFMRLLGPQYIDRISYYPKGKALFRDFKVDEEITKLMRPRVMLPSGGSLVIETTEALTVIDVNSGKYAGKTHEDTILHTNLEAASEIARQVRLRDIGGIIVCDFIDMNSEVHRTKILTVLETGLRRDRTRTIIQSFSALGLLEFTRKRVGKDLSAQLRASCPTCRGLGDVLSPETVTIETFRAVEHHQHHGSEEKPLSIVASPTVGAQIRYWHEEELAELAKKTARKISIVIDPSGHPERTRVLADPAHIPPSDPVMIRVGDELDAEILPMRMPNPSSGVALVKGRLIEVENASAAVGLTLGIRVIDVDDATEEILAEPRGPLANVDPKRRRRKHGRVLTPADQIEELRELAEEAARIAALAPPIRLTPALTPPLTPMPTAKSIAPPAAPAAPASRPGMPQRFVRRPNPAVIPPRRAAAAALPPEEFFDPTPFYEQHPRVPAQARAQRFQPRALREGLHTADPAQSTGSVDLENEESDEELDRTGLSDEAVPLGDGQRRRRRRRRRGRGRGGATDQVGVETTPFIPENPAVPNRTIFRVSTSTAPEPTGEVAPPEPSRAVTPWRSQPAHVALEAPPPSLHIQEGLPVARPARRGRPPKNPLPAAQLTTTTRPALSGQSTPEVRQQPTPSLSGRAPAVPERPMSTPPRRIFTPAPPIPAVARPVPVVVPPAPVVAPPAPMPVPAAAEAPNALPRRRGRPPKYPASIAAAAAREAAREAATKVAPPVAPIVVEVPSVPRKRGRPRKDSAVPPLAPPLPVSRARVVASKAPLPQPQARGRKPAVAPVKTTTTRRKKSS